MKTETSRIPVGATIAVAMLVGVGLAANRARAGQPTSMTITEGGKPAATIVVSADASEPLAAAVKDLQLYIAKISGATLPIADSPATPGNLILVGRMPAVDKLIPDLDEYDLGHDGIVIKLFGGKLVITGKSDGYRDKGKWAGAADCGTPNAIYYFLETLGCRWYMPGDDGEVVPRRQSITVSDLDVVSKPDFRGRWVNVGASQGVHRNEFIIWLRRNRTTRGANFYYQAHGMYSLLPPKLFKEHPEYFALVNGKRTGAPQGQFCLSNPDVLDTVCANLRDALEKQGPWRAYPLGQYDSFKWCECDNCLSWYGDKTFVYKDVKEARAIGHGPGDRVFPNIANGYLKFVNAVADRIRTTHPDVPLNYYALYNIPGFPEVTPADNVMPTMCHLAPKDDALRRQVEQWVQVSKQLYYYTYMGYATAFPKFTIVNDIRWAHEHKGVAMFMEMDEYSPANMIPLYLATRAMWDINVDAEKILDEFYRTYYGPAEPVMRKFWQRFHEITLTEVLEYDCSGLFPEALTPEVAADFRQYLTKASELADQPVVKRRIELAGTYWRSVELQVEAQKALAEWRKHKTSENQKTAKNAVTKLMEYIDAIAPHGSSPGMWLRWRLGMIGSWLSEVAADPANVIMDLPVTWRFKKDPSDVGMKEKWFAADRDPSWVQISTEQDWISQGHNYHGVAWYRTSFALPEKQLEKGNRLALFFGAVDGYADVFLNGAKIGEQKKPPGDMWNQPFTIPLPVDLEPGKAHQLMVRVEKESLGAGIWKGVSVMKRAK